MAKKTSKITKKKSVVPKSVVLREEFDELKSRVENLEEHLAFEQAGGRELIADGEEQEPDPPVEDIEPPLSKGTLS